MAGRGRGRLGDLAESVKKMGLIPLPVDDETPADLELLIKSISDINVKNVQQSLIKTIEDLFKELCKKKDTLKSILLSLHSKALCDISFGEKLVIALVKVSSYEVDGISVRNMFLTVMQEEFNFKDKMFQSNKPRLYNAIQVLGSFYHYINIQGSPLWVLGMALTEYLELLIKGSHEEYSVFTKQIALNHGYLSAESKISQKYSTIQNNLRETLIKGTCDSLTKYWILLVIELMSGSQVALTDSARDFYLSNLGDDFVQVESFIKLSQENLKKTNNKNIHAETNAGNKFIDIDLSSPLNDNYNSKKNKMSADKFKTKKMEYSKWSPNYKGNFGRKGGFSKSGHDDRFDKDENYYGSQPQRTKKSDHQSKNFSTVIDQNLPKTGLNKSNEESPPKNENIGRLGESWD